jgi:hypothetical protein
MVLRRVVKVLLLDGNAFVQMHGGEIVLCLSILHDVAHCHKLRHGKLAWLYL